MANKVGSDHTHDVYVARIPADVDETKLKQLFDPIGTVKSVHLKPGKGEHTLKYAFIKFETESDALCAVRYMNNQQVGDSKILVNYRRKEGSTSSSESGSTGGFGGLRSPMKVASVKGFGGAGFVHESTQNSDLWVENDASSGNHVSSSALPTGFKKPTLFDEVRVAVVHIDDYSEIWVQSVSEENAARINRLSAELGKECNVAQSITGEPPYDKVFGCKFSADNQWYRCKVCERLPDSKVKIQYIDYGNCEVVRHTSLMELTSSLQHMPPCAEQYKLRVKSMNEDKNSDIFKSGLEHVKEMLFDKIVKLVIETGTNVVTKAVDDGTKEDIIENLIKSGHAAPADKMPEKDKAAPWPLRSPRTINSLPNGTHNKQNDGLQKQIADLTAQLNASNTAQEKLQDDVRTLRHKNSQLEQSVALSSSKLRSLSNSLINEQFSKMIHKVEDLKALRNDLYMDDTLNPTLKKAVALVTEGAKAIKLNELSSYEKLLHAERELSSIQMRLKSCTDADKLDTLVLERDEMRKRYLNEIEAFISETDCLDFDDRRSDLECILKDIEREFTSSLTDKGDAQKVVDSLQAYEDWKANKIGDIREIQQDANFCCLALDNTLEILKMKLSIKAQPLLVDIGNEAAEPGNLDQLLQDYSQALAAESSKLKDLNIDTEGKAMISNLVSSLLRAIHEELSDIQTLSGQLIASYRDKKIEVEKWIVARPDISKLKENKVALKSFKSKFRHKQADRRDYEEDSDESDQLVRIEEEIETLRNQIHSLFVEEKELLRDLSQVTEQHFPELKIQFPELGIASFLESNGLLQARELEHYSHHSMPLVSSASSQPVVFRTRFNQQDCVIKEYSLNSELTKDVIRSRMFAYSRIEHENAVHLDALFFDKAGRKAYLQTPFFAEENLKDFMNRNPKPENIAHVSFGILSALVAIHEKDCIHGSISPKCVFMQVSDAATAVVKEPNFSKDESQRFKDISNEAASDSCYPNFNANAEPASKELDAYCFGLLMFWANFPTTHHSGTPLQMLEQERTQMDDALYDLLRGLLSGDQTRRMNLQEALDHPHFSFFRMRSQSPSEELLSAIKDPGDSFAIIEMNESAEQKDAMTEPDTVEKPVAEEEEGEEANPRAASEVPLDLPSEQNGDLPEDLLDKEIAANE